MSFTKLHESLVHSTIWREPNHVRVVWVTMMAIADKHGEIQASVPGLADLSRVTIKECEDALKCFTAPDPYSRSKDFEGRRIEEIEGGWALLNHPKYRLLASKDDQKERSAIRAKRYRHARGVTVTPEALPSRTVTLSRDIAEAEADTNTDSLSKERKREGVGIGLPEVITTGRRFPDHAAICARINAMRPEWAKPSQWSGVELHHLHGALGQIEEMTDDDWRGMSRYIGAKMPEGSNFWQPRNRSKFVETLANVYCDYQRWSKKNRQLPTCSAPKPQPAPEQTEEDKAAVAEFLKDRRKP